MKVGDRVSVWQKETKAMLGRWIDTEIVSVDEDNETFDVRHHVIDYDVKGVFVKTHRFDGWGDTWKTEI